MIAWRLRGECWPRPTSKSEKALASQSQFFIDDMSSSREIESKISEMAENPSTARVQIVFVIERRRINKFSNFPICYSFSLLSSSFPVQDECSVQNLIENCIIEDDKLYICVSSPTIKNKPVQIRPWRLSDADFVLDASMSLDPRKTVFVGGVPRPLKACKLT